MSGAGLTVEATLSRATFALKERIELSLVLGNRGSVPVTVPHPFRGLDAAASLELRPPRGPVRTLRLCDVRPGPGVKARAERVRVLPGQTEILTFDVADRFDLLDVGAYALAVVCLWAADEAWHSPELHFSILPSAEGYLDVVPTETAALGYQAVLWSEPDGDADRVLLFDGGPSGTRLFGARSALSMARAARPAVSTAPAGLPQTDRWIAWVSSDGLNYAFLSEEAAVAIPPRIAAFPAGITGPGIVRPVLAEHAPDEVGPGASIGIVAGNADGGSIFQLARVARDGGVQWSSPLALPGPVIGDWATFVSPQAGLIVLAVAGAGVVRIMGIGVLWDGSCGEPSELFTVSADRLLYGDVRSDPQGRTWLGLLVARGEKWARVTFALPSGEREDGGPADEWLPGPGAMPSHARLDGAGQLHVLYRQGGRLCYLPPGATEAPWSSEALHVRASAEHLVLRPRHPTLLVYRDSVEGASIVHIDVQAAPGAGRSNPGPGNG